MNIFYPLAAPQMNQENGLKYGPIIVLPVMVQTLWKGKQNQSVFSAYKKIACPVLVDARLLMQNDTI